VIESGEIPVIVGNIGADDGNLLFCRIQRVPGRAGSGLQGAESSRVIGRTSAQRRPPCQSCGDEAAVDTPRYVGWKVSP
jgi:hypothetical protein